MFSGFRVRVCCNFLNPQVGDLKLEVNLFSMKNHNAYVWKIPQNSSISICKNLSALPAQIQSNRGKDLVTAIDWRLRGIGQFEGPQLCESIPVPVPWLDRIRVGYFESREEAAVRTRLVARDGSGNQGQHDDWIKTLLFFLPFPEKNHIIKPFPGTLMIHSSQSLRLACIMNDARLVTIKLGNYRTRVSAIFGP